MKTFEESTAYPVGVVSKPPSHYSVAVRTPEINPNVGTITHKDVPLDKGLEYLRAFAKRGNYYHALLMEHEDGSLHVSERTNQPCWGSLREYGSKSTRPYDGWPGDLRTPERTFPQGKPVAVAIPIGGSGYNPDASLTEWITHKFLGENSPYWEIGAKAEPEWLLNGNKQVVGLVLHNTNIDPSLMVNMFRASRNVGGWGTRFLKFQQAFPKLHEKALWMLTLSSVSTFTVPFTYNFGLFGGAPDLARVRDGQILEGLREGLFRDRYSYNRPLIDCIFGYDPPKKMVYTNKVFNTPEEYNDWIMNLKQWEY